ncbi:MAG: STAS domain-containing protein [Planctomycetota bacterium]
MHAQAQSEGSSTGRRAAAARPGWDVAVERGPDWLFLRLESGTGGAGDGSLSDRLLGTIRANRAHRVVLELDRVESMDAALLDAIATVGTHVRGDGGLVRVCGLSEGNLRQLQTSAAGKELPHFESRSAAVGPRCGAMP